MDWQEVLNILSERGITLLQQHLSLVGISLTAAIVIAFPVGILITRPPFNKWSTQVLSILNTAQGLPSLAIVAVFLPIMGIGRVPAMVAITLYGLLPIARNTIAGIQSVDANILEAAKGMGMPAKKILYKIEIPLALPVIFAGIQTAAVLTVGTATLAHLVGGGGLGRLIFSGISMFKPELTIAGSLIAAAIAIILDQSIGFIHRLMSAKYCRY
ncbi:MAG: ABC transporter permease [Mahellales bacterium]|jgi:osmoprotectant transport system permease protein